MRRSRGGGRRRGAAAAPGTTAPSMPGGSPPLPQCTAARGGRDHSTAWKGGGVGDFPSTQRSQRHRYASQLVRGTFKSLSGAFQMKWGARQQGVPRPLCLCAVSPSAHPPWGQRMRSSTRPRPTRRHSMRCGRRFSTEPALSAGEEECHLLIGYRASKSGSDWSLGAGGGVGCRGRVKRQFWERPPHARRLQKVPRRVPRFSRHRRRDDGSAPRPRPQ